MKKPKVYISGKITGIDNYSELFQKAETHLVSKGYEVVNPVKLVHDHDGSWESYMRVDLMALLDCNAIYLLRNHMDSRGTLIEKSLAHNLSFEIIHEPSPEA